MEIKDYIDREQFVSLLKDNITKENAEVFLEKRAELNSLLNGKSSQEKAAILKTYKENYDILAENVYFENLSLEDALNTGIAETSEYSHPYIRDVVLKLKKLVELYNIKIYVGTNDYLAYKDKDNVDEEFYRIAADLGLLNSPFIQGCIEGNKYKSEYIAYINDRKPEMLSNSNYLAEYSAAINGLKHDDETSAIEDLEKFLKGISTRTIHY